MVLTDSAVDKVVHIVFISILNDDFSMLEEFGNEIDNTETKIDATLKKVAKILRVNNGQYPINMISCTHICNNFLLSCGLFPDSRQWMAIGVLSALLFIVILLLIIL